MECSLGISNFLEELPSLVFPILFFPSISFHWSLRKVFPLTLSKGIFLVWFFFIIDHFTVCFIVNFRWSGWDNVNTRKCDCLTKWWTYTAVILIILISFIVSTFQALSKNFISIFWIFFQRVFKVEISTGRNINHGHIYELSFTRRQWNEEERSWKTFCSSESWYFFFRLSRLRTVRSPFTSYSFLTYNKIYISYWNEVFISR